MRDPRPLLARVVNPGVPWWLAVPCNILAGTALVLLILDPADMRMAALVLLGLAAVVLYGMAPLLHIKAKRR